MTDSAITRPALRGRLARAATLALSACVIAGCNGVGCAGSKAQAALWDFAIPDIQAVAPKSGIVSIDLYLDSTASMEGFAVAPSAEMPQFVSALEGSIGQGWDVSAVRYFRFGTRVVEWTRERFVRGMVSSGFYHERGVSETTNIDQLIAAADASHLSLVVTDLFQTDADVNAVVAAIKTGFIAKGVSMGLLPVPAEFDGQVFDAHVPPFRYASRTSDPSSKRPFYLMMFGPEHQIERLVKVLSAKDHVDPSQFLLITRSVVNGQTVALAETPRSKNIVNTVSRTPHPHEFSLDLRDDSPATFEVVGTLGVRKGVAPLETSRLEAVITRRRLPKGGVAGPEESAADLALAGPIRLDGSRVRVPLRLQFKERNGAVAYRVDVTTPSVGGFGLPAWVNAWSSDDPRPGHDPNKTLNLKPFVQGLLQALQSTSRSPVLRFFLFVRKP